MNYLLVALRLFCTLFVGHKCTVKRRGIYLKRFYRPGSDFISNNASPEGKIFISLSEFKIKMDKRKILQAY